MQTIKANIMTIFYCKLVICTFLFSEAYKKAKIEASDRLSYYKTTKGFNALQGNCIMSTLYTV